MCFIKTAVECLFLDISIKALIAFVATGKEQSWLIRIFGVLNFIPLHIENKLVLGFTLILYSGYAYLFILFIACTPNFILLM